LSWRDKHETQHSWIIWSGDSAYLLYHWLFNWRYVKSTFRLPVLKKSSEFHNKKLDKIIKQREDQHVLFSPKELEDFAREMGKLKKTQVRHENYATVIEVIVLLLVAASSYFAVYVSYSMTQNFLYVSMFLLLNGVMLYAVVKMRFAIKSMPNLFPNENLVVIHVLLFTVVSGLWPVYRVY